MPRQVIVQKTAIFKLYNPSASKRRILDLAFARYGEAYNLLLEKCKPITESWLETARGGERLPSLYRAAQQIYPLCPEAKDLTLPGSLRDGLITDVAGNLLSYCQLALDWKPDEHKDKRAGEPRYPAPDYGFRPDAYYETLAEAAAWVGEHPDFLDFQARLTREAMEAVRPLHFCRLRDFSLERLEKERWGVTLNLQPRGHTPTRLRFPLAFGEWHEEEYLKKGRPRCAHLCRREREYFLHVSFEFPVEVMQPGEEQSYLGIDRGITKQAAYALVDLRGQVIQTGALGRELRGVQITLGRYLQAKQKAGRRVSAREWQRRHQEEMLHQIANALVELASKNRALVVMENLNLRNASRFVRSQYAKFAKILDYKLNLAGLSSAKQVFAALSSKICYNCGEEGQREDEFFCCLKCQRRLDADENAAVNIARRALYRKSEWERRGGYQAFHRSFGSV